MAKERIRTLRLVCFEHQGVRYNRMTQHETFGRFVARHRGTRTVADCARAAGMTWTQWDAIEKDEPKRQNGDLPRRTAELVRRVAGVLGVPENIARKAAGLPVETEDNAEIPTIMAFYDGLPQEGRDELEQYAQFLWQRYKRNETTHGKKAG